MIARCEKERRDGGVQRDMTLSCFFAFTTRKTTHDVARAAHHRVASRVVLRCSALRNWVMCERAFRKSKPLAATENYYTLRAQRDMSHDASGSTSPLIGLFCYTGKLNYGR